MSKQNRLTKDKSPTQRIATFSLATTLAFIFSYIETLFPLPLPFPGIKLGLANLILVLLLYDKGIAFCASVSLVRNVLTALTFGNLYLFIYSSAGSTLSLFFMWIFFRKGKWSIFTISMLGGIAHNLGQFIVAALTIGGTSLVGYAPVLYFSGMITGGLIGLVSYECKKRLKGIG